MNNLKRNVYLGRMSVLDYVSALGYTIILEAVCHVLAILVVFCSKKCNRLILYQVYVYSTEDGYNIYPKRLPILIIHKMVYIVSLVLFFLYYA